MKNFFQYSRYLFVLVHPDDEIYTCAFIQQLVNDGKRVDILFATSGDYHGPEMATVREEEARVSMRLMNVNMGNVYFMGVPERRLMGQVNAVGADRLRHIRPQHFDRDIAVMLEVVREKVS